MKKTNNAQNFPPTAITIIPPNQNYLSKFTEPRPVHSGSLARKLMNYQFDVRFTVHHYTEEEAKVLLEDHLEKTSRLRAIAAGPIRPARETDELISLAFGEPNQDGN